MIILNILPIHTSRDPFISQLLCFIVQAVCVCVWQVGYVAHVGSHNQTCKDTLNNISP